MTYKNTYKFLQNVLELEDAAIARTNNKMNGGSLQTRSSKAVSSKYVRREEYDELVRELDKLKCQLEAIQTRGLLKKNMKGGADDEEYEMKDAAPEPEKKKQPPKPVVKEESPKPEIKEQPSELEIKEEYPVESLDNDIEDDDQDKSDSSSSVEEEEFTPTLEGGADANDILKELGDFNNYYMNSVKESKPALKGGFEVSSSQFNWYPY